MPSGRRIRSFMTKESFGRPARPFRIAQVSLVAISCQESVSGTAVLHRAIVRRGSFVVGVTTAATIWMLTVLGLCFGGGQLRLGLVGAAIAVAIPTLLKHVELRMKQDRQGRLVIVAAVSRPDESEIRGVIETHGYTIASCGYLKEERSGLRKWTCDLHWRATPADTGTPDFLARLTAAQRIVRIVWTPRSRRHTLRRNGVIAPPRAAGRTGTTR